MKMAIRFNNGRGAITCDKCNIIIRENIDPRTIKNIYHFCDKCVKKRLKRMLKRKNTI